MRKYKFFVDFGDEVLTITSGSPHSAAILAMAQRIKDAKHYVIKHVKDEQGHYWMQSYPFELKNIG